MTLIMTSFKAQVISHQWLGVRSDFKSTGGKGRKSSLLCKKSFSKIPKGEQKHIKTTHSE